MIVMTMRRRMKMKLVLMSVVGRACPSKLFSISGKSACLL
jgi:hypothetical protein